MGRYNFNQRTRDGYEISPEQAAKWLERNDNNRNVNVAKVKKMAKDMREGHFYSSRALSPANRKRCEVQRVKNLWVQ